jgi:hypothetical protein
VAAREPDPVLIVLVLELGRAALFERLQQLLQLLQRDLHAARAKRSSRDKPPTTVSRREPWFAAFRLLPRV